MLRFSVVGAAQIDGGGEPVTASAGTKFGVLLYLACNRGVVVERPLLWRLFYPRASHDSARHSLRQLVYRLSQEGFPVERSRDGLMLPTASVDFDYLDTLKLVSDELRIGRIAGGILPMYEPRALPELSDWLDQFRASVERHIRGAIVQEMVLARKRRAWPQAERLAAGCLSLDPLNEEAVLVRAEALAHTGAKARAVSSLDAYLTEIGGGVELSLSAESLRHRIRATSEQEEFPFVGSPAALTSCERLIAGVREGRCSSLLVPGEGGSGKSRLISEVALRAELSGCTALAIRLADKAIAKHLSPLGALAKAIVEAPGALGASPESLATVNDAARGRSVTSERARNLENAIIQVIAAVAAERPLILLIDDADRVDDMAAHLVRGTIAAGVRGFGLIATVSSEGRLAFGLAEVASVALLPLNRTDATLLATEALRGLPAEICSKAETLAIEACGNPKLLVSLISETKRRGAVPASLGSLARPIQERVERLSRDAKLVLSVVVCSDGPIPSQQLDDACELAGHRLLAALSELEGQQLISPASDGRIQAAHSEIRNHASGLCGAVASATVRARLATRAGSAFPEHPALGHMWASAQRWSGEGRADLAFETLRLAGRQAQRAGLPGPALAFFERALSYAPEPENTAEILEALVVCGAARAAWPTVLSAVRGLRELAGGSARDYRKQAALHLRETQALFGLGQTAAAQVRLLLGDLSDAEVGDVERYCLAATLVQIAEIDFDRVSADEIRSRVDDLKPTGASATSALHFYMIYETTFGGHEVAADFARRLRSVVRAKPLDTLGLRWLGHAGCVLRRAGEIDEAISVQEESYNLAKDAAFDHTCCLAASELATMAWLADDATTALRWHDIATTHLSSLPRGQAPGGYYNNAVNFALDSGNSAAARAVLASVEQDVPVLTRPGHQALTSLAFRCLARFVDGDVAADPAEAAALEEGHVRGRSFAAHDIIAEATNLALTANGERARATELLRDYVSKYRRDRYPLVPRLRRLVAENAATPATHQ